jgi:L-arabinokinase
MTHLAAYITGHGFGHATRAAALLAAAAARRPVARLTVISTAPEWLFRLNLPVPFDYRAQALDIGAIQRDAIRMDLDATLAACRRLLQEAPGRIAAEADFLRRAAVDAVLADIPWMAFPAARRAGIPAVGVSNFSWDWIYDEYAAERPEFARVAAAIREGYTEADLFLRLPFHGPCDAFPVVRDIPMIARLARRPREAIRRALSLNGDRPVVLLSFGGFEIQGIDLAEVERLRDYCFLTTQALSRPVENIRVFSLAGVTYEEAVAQADAVITKPGYGIVSDCLANRTPVLYTSRGMFAEYPYLVRGLEQFGVCEYLSNEDLLAGRWGPALTRLLRRPRHWPALRSDGAEVAAGILAGLADHRQGSADPTPLASEAVARTGGVGDPHCAIDRRARGDPRCSEYRQ